MLSLERVKKWAVSKLCLNALAGRVPTTELVNKTFAFCELYTGKHFFPYQEQFMKRIIRSVLENDGAEITALFSRQSGKCFAKGTKILMHSGRVKPVEQIKVGDKVMRPNGEPAIVISLGRGREQMYEVRSREKNHESFVVNESHILALVNRKGEYENIKVKDYLKLPKWKRKDEYRGYRVAVDFDEKTLPIEPYFLGLWVGDGTSSDVSITNIDKEVIDYLYEYADRLGMRVSVYQTGNRTPTYAITNGNEHNGGSKTNILRDYLQDNHLINHKTIPSDIMYNSREVRLQFLAGLIDSDGHMSTIKGKENTLEITTISLRLSNQYVRLLRSLGFRTSKTKRMTTCNGKKCPSYRVSAYGDFSVVPCKIPRKQRDSKPLRENPLTFGFDLIPKGEGNYYGFTIDTPDHLFLLGDYTVVHNTESVAAVTGGLMILFPTLANMPMFAGDTRLQAYKNGVMVGIFAPALMQAQINYNRMKAFLTSHTAEAIFADAEFRLSFTTSNGQTVKLSNGSFASAFSASDQSNIEGLSFHLIICEEAQDISDFKMLKSISPMGAAYNATQIKVGTATTFKASFYRSIMRNKEEAKQRSTHIRNHFEYDCDVACKYNKNYAKYVANERKRLGEKSDEFLMSYKLQWIVERGMLIDVEKFEANNTEPMLGVVDYDKLATHVVGIDVGGSEGGDSTVITVVEVDWSLPAITESKTDEETGEELSYNAYTTYLKAWYEIKDLPDYEEQYVLIKDFLSHFKIARVVIDATREKSLADRLSANLSCEVVPFVFSPKGKSDLYKNFIKEINTGRVRVPYNQKTIDSVEYQKYIQQMGDMQKGYRGSYLTCSHPPIKGAHDDYPDSHALAVWGASYEGEVSHIETKDRRNLIGKDERYSFHRGARSLTARRR